MIWESIIREHGPMAFDTAWRILGQVQDTEDAVQEAFLDALRIGRDGEVRNWGGLLRRLATRRALDRLRRRKTVRRLEAEPPSPTCEQPELVAAEKELAERLRRAVATIPDRQAMVFSLSYFGELSNPEIASLLGISVGAVATALNKARASLAELINDPKPNEARRAVR